LILNPDPERNCITEDPESLSNPPSYQTWYKLPPLLVWLTPNYYTILRIVMGGRCLLQDSKEMIDILHWKASVIAAEWGFGW